VTYSIPLRINIHRIVALMARPVAGVRNKTLIITLPGSPKGAKENLLGILVLLPHACLQAAGADSRTLHAGGVKKLEQDAGIAKGTVANVVREHDHSHGHRHAHGSHSAPVAHTTGLPQPRSNDPNAGPSRRYRSSPYPMVSVDEATALIAANIPTPQTIKARADKNLVGCTLAESVAAPEAVPAFRASIVDGYAITVSPGGPSTKGVFPVVSVSHARPGEIPPLKPGQIARITTGAPLPEGATSVVMVEDTVLTSATETREEKEVEILTDKIKPGENVREVGSDIQAGTIVLRKGDEITAVGGELGLLASVGKSEVVVYKRSIVGVLSTGDEIVPHDKAGELRLGEVRDCNRPTIIAALEGWGFEVVDLGIARDT
jgi:gephyrin